MYLSNGFKILNFYLASKHRLYELRAFCIYFKHFENKYCDDCRYGNQKKNERHTMCIYDEGAQELCGKVQTRGVTTQVRHKYPSNLSHSSTNIQIQAFKSFSLLIILIS